MQNTIVIGGGFYGSMIALHLAEKGARITLLEREAGLMRRASYHNQARVHNGYHYPRSFNTAWRSHLNLRRFVAEFRTAIVDNFTHIYAVARHNSKVSARQFAAFCASIEAPLKVAAKPVRALFNPRLIEEAFEVEEYAFNTEKLGAIMLERLKKAGVTLRFNTEVQSLEMSENGVNVTCATGETLHAHQLFNCTYSGLENLSSEPLGLKHEITEMALVHVPESLKSLGVTVMDGAFFSLMPFPAEGLHTLSHVRYTPHMAVPAGMPPYAALEAYDKRTRFGFMARDATRYMPLIAEVTYRKSLFEVKTVLAKNETDDGRPILARKNSFRNCTSILGSKIDTIYDILEVI